jgi:hypothetical protein
MQTDDLEQKKLVYLYLMNYAKTQPELVILAVNTFVKDTDDPNPLVRALAIRTMGCLRAEKIIDYLSDPLQKCLRDENPYVRKTAALCVAKLYDLKPELVIDNGFLEQLQDMIADSNPMVRSLLPEPTPWPDERHEGRCEHRRSVDGHPHRGDITSRELVIGTRILHHHNLNLEQTVDRSQRMLRMGSRGYPECVSSVRGPR